MTLITMDKLFISVHNKDAPEVIEHLVKRNNIDVNSCWKDDYSLLMIAARKGHVKSVKKLIELGVDVNASSSTGKTALMEAAQKNQCEVIKILLEHGVNRKAYDKDYWSALSYAVHFENDEAYELLDENTIKVSEMLRRETAAMERFLNVHRPEAPSVAKTTQTSTTEINTTVPLITEVPPTLPAEAHPTAPSDQPAVNAQEGCTLWIHHLAAHHLSPEVIALCEDKLVRQEGFGCARTLAFTPAAQFNQAYLQGLGITGLGVQHVLLQLHREFVVNSNISVSVGSDTVIVRSDAEIIMTGMMCITWAVVFSMLIHATMFHERK